MEGRPVCESASELSEFALPNYANPLGNLLGGRILHLVDMAAATAAMRHARCPVVTASVDSFLFLNPIHIGQLIILRASVNRVFRTSMEIGVKVWQEQRSTGDRKHVASAYLTFVSLDPESRAPRPVPPVLPETEDEKRRFAAAQQRRANRLQARK